MKPVGIVLCLLLLWALPASAQTPRFEVSGGYSFMRDQDRSEDFPAGWVVLRCRQHHQLGWRRRRGRQQPPDVRGLPAGPVHQ